MKRKLIVIIGLIITVLFLSGCLNNDDTVKYTKIGKVKYIEYDVAFGGTFTDWRNEIVFYDGTCLFTKYDDDLRWIEYNRTGKFYFDKTSREYDGWTYTWYDFQGVEWIDEN